MGTTSRADDELRTYAVAVNERHREAAEALFRGIVTDRDLDGPFGGTAVKFVMALFDGLVLHRMSGYDDGEGRAVAVMEAAKRLAGMAFERDTTNVGGRP